MLCDSSLLGVVLRRSALLITCEARISLMTLKAWDLNSSARSWLSDTASALSSLKRSPGKRGARPDCLVGTASSCCRSRIEALTTLNCSSQKPVHLLVGPHSHRPASQPLSAARHCAVLQCQSSSVLQVGWWAHELHSLPGWIGMILQKLHRRQLHRPGDSRMEIVKLCGSSPERVRCCS